MQAGMKKVDILFRFPGQIFGIGNTWGWYPTESVAKRSPYHWYLTI
jgi:hypothetical protein